MLELAFFVFLVFEMIFLIRLIFFQIHHPFNIIIMQRLEYILILNFIDFRLAQIKLKYLLVTLISILIAFLSKF